MKLRYAKVEAPAGLTRYHVLAGKAVVILAVAEQRRGGYWRARSWDGTRSSSAWCRTRKEAIGQVLDLTA